MSQVEAAAAAQALKSILEKHGVTVSIELQADTRGVWDVVGKRGVISHHTASHISQGATPVLALVKRGRTSEGISGPLANGYGGRDLVYRILCMGKANHAGLGGPLTLGQYVPKDYGNLYTWGTEYEGGYESWDDMPGMREFMGRSNAALVEYFGYGPEGHGEHKTWAPTRKIDRLNYTTQSGRDELVAYSGAAPVTNPIPVPVPVPVNPWAGKDSNAVYAPGSRIVRLYDAGTDVAFVQARVGAGVDGWFGFGSVAKVKAFQKSNGLVDDGIVGPLTWGRLLGTVSPAPAPVAPPFPLPSGYYFGYKSGGKYSISGYYSHRQDLKNWQQRMKDRGWGIEVDGLYGDNTHRVAVAFQTEKGLAPDGKIGPVTWKGAWTIPVT